MRAEEHPGLAARWRRLRPGQRAVAVLLGVVVSVNVLVASLRWLTGPAPAGPPSSSYATARRGVAAYADLLERHGRTVRRLRSRLHEARLDPGTTLVVLDPEDIDDREVEALRRFVVQGGRLVAGGRTVRAPLRRLLPETPVWAPVGVREATVMAPAPEVAGVSTLRAAGEGAWTTTGSALPLAGEDDRVLVAAASPGAGRVLLLADASVLQNRLLGAADNAAFGLALAGEPTRPVAFAEAAHGYGTSQGPGALPGRWKWALAGGLLATLLWMWSRGKRLGPAEEESRDLPPPRRTYVDSLAATSARARQPGPAVEPLRRAARARVAERAGLSPGADDAAVRQAAERLGAPPEHVAALVGPVTSDRDAVAVGRAAAWVEESLR